MTAADRAGPTCARPASHAYAAAPPTRRCFPVGAEECAQLLRVELGLLEGREVSAACGLGHPHNVRPCGGQPAVQRGTHLDAAVLDRKSTRLNSSHANISYAVFCL